jgi:hypothetical protein
VGGIVVSGGKEMIKKIIEQIVEKLCDRAYQSLSNFFKARAAEFKEAQAKPQDGVTVKVIWTNVQGMATIRTVINAIRGKLSLGNIGDLTLPNIGAPDIRITADKQFD